MLNIGAVRNGVNGNGPVWQDPSPLERGRRYDIELFTFIDPSGDGRVALFRDGVKLVDYRGPVGYRETTATFAAWCFYRHGPGKETQAVRYDHPVFEWGEAVAFPDQETAAPMLMRTRPIAAAPQVKGAALAVKSLAGPFVHDADSYRATVSLRSPPDASVTFTIDNKPVLPAQVTTTADGTRALNFIRLLPEGPPALIEATVNGARSAPLSLRVVGGKVQTD